jgi:hypothetical protein
MSTAQINLPAYDAEPAFPETVPDGPSRPMAVANGEPCGEYGMDNRPDLRGHTLLSRSRAPQGRRSLFRR